MSDDALKVMRIVAEHGPLTYRRLAQHPHIKRFGIGPTRRMIALDDAIQWLADAGMIDCIESGEIAGDLYVTEGGRKALGAMGAS